MDKGDRKRNSKKIKKNYYAIIPANVRYDKDICANAKLLYGEITALCNEKGYCWASNEYFSDLYSVTDKSIKNWIKDLREKNYIHEELTHIRINGTIKTKRKISIITENNFQSLRENNFQSLRENNFQSLGEKNFPYNNTYNNTSNISEEENFYQEDNFNKIWKEYPKKENRLKAFKEYIKLFECLKEKNESNSETDITRNINRQIWFAVRKYADLVKKEKRESKYIQQGYNFFKEGIFDYIEPLKEYIKGDIHE